MAKASDRGGYWANVGSIYDVGSFDASTNSVLISDPNIYVSGANSPATSSSLGSGNAFYPTGSQYFQAQFEIKNYGFDCETPRLYGYGLELSQQSVSSDARSDFDQVLSEAGRQVRIRFFTASGATTSYDDHVVLSQSGNDYYCLGVNQPVGGKRDFLLLQQGRIKAGDIKLYLPGAVPLSGAETLVRIGIGSPCNGTLEYGISEGGITSWEKNGVIVYHKAYLTHLPNGSLVGE
jgi:hypothetical protein